MKNYSYPRGGGKLVSYGFFLPKDKVKFHFRRLFLFLPFFLLFSLVSPAYSADSTYPNGESLTMPSVEANCKNATLSLDGTGNLTVLVTDVDDGSSTDIGGTISLIGNVNFDCSHIGVSQQVTLEAMSSDGLATATCNAMITVLDDLAPVANCVASISVSLDNMGDVSITPADIDNGSTDNCDNTLALSLDVSDFTCANVGSNTVTLTVEDDYTNSSTCTATVNVLDDPTAICQDISVDLDMTGNASIIPEDLDNSSSDVCNAPVSFAASLTAFDCANIGANSVDLTVTDATGVSSTCTSTVTVNDVTPPTPVCQDIDAILDGSGTVTVNASAVDDNSTDECSSTLTFSLDQSTFSCADTGAIPVVVTLTVDDGNGNTSTCTADITVLDQTDPTANCPADIAVNTTPGSCDAVVNFTIPAPDDNCTGATSVAVSASGSTFGEGTNTVTVTATDASGNTDDCTFIIEVTDNEAPVFTICPAGPVTQVVDAGQCDAIVDYSGEYTVSDNCSTNISGAPASGTMFGVGLTPVTVTVTDDAGNSADCSFNVVVIDNEDPVAVCPADITVDTDAGSCDAVVNYTLPASTDNCTVVTSSADMPSGSTFSEGTTIVTVTAEDASTNMNTCTFTVTVSDNEAPVAACPADIAIDTDGGLCEAVVTYTLPVSSDNCSVTSSANVASGIAYLLGTTTVTVTATDGSGNTDACTFDVVVSDNENPVAACPGDIAIDTGAGSCDAVVTFTLPASSDNCSVSSVADIASGSTFVLGTTTVNVTATDGSGNTDACTFDVVVSDNENPVAACPADIAIDTDGGSCDAVVTFTLPASSDNCSVTSVADMASGAAFVLGTTTVNVTATDGSGNTDACTFDVVVSDNEAPVAACPADIAIDTDGGSCDAVVTFTLPASSDNCSVTSSADIASGIAYLLGTTTVTVTATDGSGNTDACTFDVVVSDNENPVAACPADIAIDTGAGSCDAIVTYTLPVSSDNCSVTSSADIASGIAYLLGTTTVTVTATDGSGNTDACTFDVVVSDNENPVAACPADIAIDTDAGSCDAVVTFTLPASSDNCSVTSVADMASGSTFVLGTTTVNVTATDGSGNTDACTFDVVVSDNEAPVAACPADIAIDTDGGSCDAIVTYTLPVSSDNCSVTSSADIASGIAYLLGTTTVTVTATDGSGNTDACTFDVVVSDNENPVAACPADIAIDTGAGSCDAIVTYTLPVSSDNCSVTSSADIASGIAYVLGTTTVTVTATDGSGNTDACTFDVVVSDNENPVAACPADIAIDTDGGSCDAVVTYTLPASSDNCSVTSSADIASGIAYLLGTTTVTVTATDGSGNTDACTFDVVVSDNEAPVAACPADIAIDTDGGSCDAVVTYTLPASSDNCSVTSSANVASGIAYLLGTTTVTVTATDGSGNTDACTFDVVVSDNENPVAACPADIAIDTGAGSCDAIVTYTLPVSSDNCSVTSSADIASGIAYVLGTTTVTVTATDGSGNTDACTFDVVVSDNENPVAACPADIAIDTDGGSCDAVVTFTLPASSDNCSVTSVADMASGSTFVLGTTTVNVTATDGSGNTDACTFDVVVSDNEAPVAACPADIAIDTDGGLCEAVVTYTLPVSSDNCSVTSSADIASGIAYVLGTTTVTVTATDGSGNTDACTFDVVVSDNENPVAACPADIAIDTDGGSCDAVVTFTLPASSDNCSVTSVADMASGSTFVLGTTTVNVTATDGSGNTDACTFDVVVSDNEAPVAACPADIAIDTDGGSCDAVVTFTLPASSDNCSVTSVADMASGSTFVLGTTTVNVTATDGSGNTDACTFDVVVSDNEAPVAACPADIAIDTDGGLCEAVVTYTLPVSSDNCSVTSSANVASGIAYVLGTTTVTVTATDGSGNTDACTFDVVVSDNEAPVAACPADIAIDTGAGSCDAIVTYTLPVSSDNCSVTSSADIASGIAYVLGTTTVTVTATDGSGNTDACTFDVVVSDNENPVAACPADIAIDTDGGSCDAVVTFTLPASSDNCSVTSAADMASGATFPLGPTTVTVTATDGSGNTDACTFDVTVSDNENPVAVCPANMVIDNDPGDCGGALMYTLPASTDNCGIQSVSSSPAAGGFFPVGIPTTVTVDVTDNSGNMDQCTFTVTVMDTEEPVVTCPADIAVNTDPASCEAVNITYTYSVIDNCSVSSDGADIPSGSTFGLGTTVVTVSAMDAVGNTGSCTFNVVVSDNEAPVAACPADIAIDTDAGSCDAVVTYTLPVSSDNCTVSSSADIASGIAYALGTTTVTVTATDGSGNTDACTFDVVVSDNENPVAACPVDIPVDTDAGVCDAVVTYTLPASSDNCTVTSSADIASGIAYALGTTTVTVTAIDGSGNTDVCTFDVVVSDNEAPVAACPADIAIDTDGGSCDAVVTFTLPASSDNCSVTSVADMASGSTFVLGTTTVTVTATDGSGNTDACTFDVVVSDNENPVAACPADIAIDTDGGSCDAVVTFTLPASSDNCSVTSVADMASGATFALGTTTVNVTATDGSGNTDACTFDVVVSDNENPVAACPGDIAIDTGAGSCDAVVTFTLPASSDNCSVSSVADIASGSTFVLGTTTVNVTATDGSGNTDACTFDVVVSDNENPVAACPADIAIDTDGGSCDAVVTFTLPASSDNCSVTSSADIASGIAYGLGTTTVTVTATDGAGNTDACTFDVVVSDNENPVAACPADIAIDTDGGSCDAVVTFTLPASSDNCSVTSVADMASGSTFVLGTTTVNVTATDGSGNTDACTFDVVVSDNEAPVAACPADIAIDTDGGSCDAVVTFTLPASSDNCSVSSVADMASGSTFVLGTTTVTVTATDGSGNTDACTFDVVVSDNENPVAACPADIAIDTDGGSCDAIVTYTLPVSSDNCSVTSSADIASGIAYGLGTTTVTVTATDGAGNTDACTFDVVVSDNENPVAACPADIAIDTDGGSCDAVVTFTLPASSDNCSVTSVADMASGSTFVLGTTTVNVTATDGSGNTDACTFDVVVSDNEAPVAACPADIAIDTDGGSCDAVVTFTLPASSDNCSVTSVADMASGATFVLGTTTVNVTATDGSGNTDACSFDVVVSDNENPVAACPADIAIDTDGGSCDAVVTFTLPASSDNCSVSSVADMASGATFALGTTTVAVTATDGAGNTDACTFDVVVSDNEAPVAACPADISVDTDLGVCDAVVTFTLPASSDNCTVSSSASIPSGAVFALGMTTVTVTATDGSGNTDACTFDVVVSDNENPTAVCPADITIDSEPGICEATVNFMLPSSTDNCGVNSVSADILSGTVFSVGTTPVTVTATDNSGNTGTCAFNVTVEDNELPDAKCLSLTVYLDALGAGSIAPANVNNASTDNCGIASLSLDDTTFDCSDINVANTVTLTVTDVNGNINTCTSNITVMDVTDPTAACLASIDVDLDANGSVTVDGVSLDNGSADECAIASYTLSQSIFDCSNIGANPVTLTVTDLGGNTDVCNTTINVSDNVSPDALCQDITVQLDATGSATITEADIDAGSSDACGLSSVSIDITSFDCASVGPNTVTLTVEDNNTNVSTCTSVVTVEDNVAPTAVCQDISVDLDVNGMATITSGDIDAGSSDACGIASTTLDITSFDCSAVGPNTVTMSVTDANGNVSTCTSTVTVSDAINSVALCQDITVQLDATGSATITASDVDGGSTDACGPLTLSIDISSFDCSSVGPNTVTLTATDVNGNAGTCTSTVSVEDNVSPDALCQDITVQLDASGAATITDADIDAGSSDACGLSSVSIDITSFDCSAVGPNTVTLTAEDVNGNVSTCTSVVTVEDNVAPTAVCQDISVDLDVNGMATITSGDIDAGSSDACGIASTTLDITSFDCSAVGPNTVTMSVTDANGNVSTCTSTVTVSDAINSVALCQDITVQLDATGSATITASDVDGGSTDACGPLTLSIDISSFDCSSVGPNTVTLTATDVNGNAGTCTSTVSVEDNVSPDALCQDITVQLDASGAATITDADIDAGSSDACGLSSVSIDITSFDCSAVGPNTVTLTAEDVNGNVSTCTSVVTVEDNVAPTAVCQDISVDLDVNGMATITSGDIDAGSSDACGIASTTLDITSFDCSAVGPNTVTMSVTDANGNVSTCTSTVTVSDAINSVALCQDITVQLDATGSATITASDVDGGSTDACGPLTLSIDISSFDCSSVGPNTVTLTATDVNGNAGTCTSTVSVEDNVSPDALCQDITVQLDASGAATITDADIDAGSSDACGLSSVSIDITSFDCSAVGPNTVTLTAEDVNGNVSTCTSVVTVEDNVAPTAVCQDISVDLDVNGMATITSGDIDAGSSDACGIASTTLDITSFDCSAVGPNTVTMTVTDANGNVSTCTSTVTVSDAINSVALCQDITVQLDATGSATITASDVDGGSTDACGPLTLSIDISSFDCSSVGPNTVTLTATDVNGNAGTCTSTVSVEDNVSPDALCQDITVQLDASGAATITDADIDAGSSDACGLSSVSIDITSFDCSAVGPNTVTLTVEDVNGNVSTCTSVVTVEDNVAPTAVCQDITVDLDVNGMATITSGDIDAGSTDACGIASTTLDITSFDCSAVGPNTVTMTVTDANGNVSTCTSIVTVSDAINSVALCQDITVQLDATGSATITASDVDGGSTDACGPLTLSIDISSFDCSSVGPNTVTLTATDVNGNAGTCTSTVSVEDNVSPDALCQDITVQLDASGAATITDADIDAGSSDACGLSSVSIDITSFDCSAVGPNTVTLTVEDVNGNVSTCTSVVTVEDNVAPTAVCQDITVDLDVNGMATITSGDIDAGSTDACGIASTTLDITSFDCSAVGANTVTLTVTDANGNVSTCTSTVTVSDAINSVALCQDITVQLDAAGSATITASDVDGGSTDACGPLTLSIDISSFDCSSVGPNTVTLTATDINGNAGTCTSTVSVEDNVSPDALCQDITVQLDASGAATITDADIDAGSSDACGLSSVSIDITSFDCSAVGPNTLTLTVEDVNGNVSTCTSVVTVEDNVSPTAVCQDITITLDANGMYALAGSEIDAGSSDNCSVTLPVNIANFDCANVGVNTVQMDVVDPSGNTASCTAEVAVIASSVCTPPDFVNEDGPNIEDPCTCRGNGEFDEEVMVSGAGLGQDWFIVSTTLLDPATLLPYAPGTLLSEMNVSGSESIYTLEGVHLDGQGYTIEVASPFYPGVVLSIGNTCYYPEPEIIGLGDIYCLSSPVITLEGDANGVVLDAEFFTINGVTATVFDPAALGLGNYIVEYTVDAGEAGSFDPSDPGCIASVSQEVNIIGTPVVFACNDNITVALDASCSALITADMALEGDIFCDDDYQVDLFDGAVAIANPVTGAYIDSDNLNFTVTHLITNNSCSGNFAIQDNIAPVCESAANITITCTEELPLADPIASSVIASDNCNVDGIILVSETTISDDLCSDYIIEREWAVIDESGNQSTQNCVQQITVTQGGFALPSDITFSCDNYTIDDLNPALAGTPEGAIADCEYSVTYGDVILPSCGNMEIIERTWTILNNCTSDITTHVQLIKLEDITGPVVEQVTYQFNASNAGEPCTSTDLVLLPSITDNCSNVSSVQLIVTGLGELDYEFDNNGNLIGGYIPAPGLPLGNHQVQVTAIDDCGNVTEAFIDIEVVDGISPTVICTEFTTVSLTSSGTAVVNAETFDNGSFDNCCLDYFEVRRMDGNAFGPQVTFDCDDETVMVVFRAVDCYNNFSECMVEVTVEDKLSAFVSCPPNATIDCGVYYSDYAPAMDAGDYSVLEDFGLAVYGDNCTFEASETVTYELDQCGNGSIERKWTVADDAGNAPVSCTQFITIEHVSEWSVSFPADQDLEVNADCDYDEIDFGQPTIANDDCEMIGVNFVDVEFGVPGQDACLKIIRTWTIINWCTYDINNSPELIATEAGVFYDLVDDQSISYTQTISIKDDQAPVVNAADFEVQITNGCGVSFELPSISIEDGCSTDTYDITLNDSGLSAYGSGGTYFGVPEGIYTVTYTVADPCGNVGTAIRTVIVLEKAPTAFCTDELVIDLSSDGEAQVAAVDFNVASSDNCTPAENLEYSFTSNISDNILSLNCDNLGDTLLTMYVFDEHGLSDFCEVTLTVQNNNGADCDQLGTLMVAGLIQTITENPVEDVSVEINGGLFVANTDVDGMYDLQLMEGEDYSIAPFYNEDVANGVTTFDIVLITQHILGMNLLDSPYKVIAADANNSQSISTLDIVEIRKVILQISEGFTNNTSWRFVDADHQFIDIYNPWGFPEIVNYNNLAEDQLETDFVAIKVGDVNGNAQSVNSTNQNRNIVESMTVYSPEINLEKGQIYDIPLSSMEEILGYQFTLNFDTKKLAFVAVESAFAGVEHFGLHLINYGAITTSWSSATPVTLEGKDVFVIRLKALEDCLLSDVLSLNGRFTAAEAYSADGELKNVQLSFGQNSNVDRNILYQNVPNPFKGETVISFELEKEGSASLEIKDVDGKVVKLIQGDFQSGLNEIRIKDLKANGLLYYTLTSGEFVASRKMLLLE